MQVRPIDANALMDALNEIITEYAEFNSGGFFAHGIRKGLNEAYRATINIPTLDYAPVEHGKWGQTEIIGYDGLHAVYGARCSECGAYSKENHRLFCSNCGAKMDGGKSEHAND